MKTKSEEQPNIQTYKKIQAFQSVTLFLIIGTPLYVSNRTLHSDQQINTISKTSSILHKM